MQLATRSPAEEAVWLLTVGSVLLAGVMLKMGTYGFVRILLPIAPDGMHTFAPYLAAFAVAGIIYGSLACLALVRPGAKGDLKRLIAYSSVSHMGFVLLGLASATPEGITGAVYQMTSHGVISAMMFLIAGVIYDRTHDRMISNYSGLSSKMPVFTSFVLVSFFAALGLPGLSGFIGEIMVFLGAFHSQVVPGWIAFISVTGLIFGAGYCLWTIQRMFFGPYAVKVEGVMNDLDAREKLMLLPLAIVIVILGIFPQLLIQYINPFSMHLVEIIKNGIN